MEIKKGVSKETLEIYEEWMKQAEARHDITELGYLRRIRHLAGSIAGVRSTTLQILDVVDCINSATKVYRESLNNLIQCKEEYDRKRKEYMVEHPEEAEANGGDAR